MRAFRNLGSFSMFCTLEYSKYEKILNCERLYFETFTIDLNMHGEGNSSTPTSKVRKRGGQHVQSALRHSRHIPTPENHPLKHGLKRRNVRSTASSIFQHVHFLTVTSSLYAFYTRLRFTMRLWLVLAAVAAATAEYVPGKAFDRFITIWLENQVCARSIY